MKRNDFEKFLSLISSDLFSFAYILIPDDLQAGQLIVDSIQSFILMKKNYLENLFTNKKLNIDEEFQLIKFEIMKNIYELSKKRYSQIKLSFNESENTEIFFRLDFDEKAMLYLKDKAKFSNEKIITLTSKNKNEVLANLYSARIKMLKGLPNLLHNEVSI